MIKSTVCMPDERGSFNAWCGFHLLSIAISRLAMNTFMNLPGIVFSVAFEALCSYYHMVYISLACPYH